MAHPKVSTHCSSAHYLAQNSLIHPILQGVRRPSSKNSGARAPVSPQRRAVWAPISLLEEQGTLTSGTGKIVPKSGNANARRAPRCPVGWCDWRSIEFPEKPASVRQVNCHRPQHRLRPPGAPSAHSRARASTSTDRCYSHMLWPIGPRFRR